jgi:hypothetical protein
MNVDVYSTEFAILLNTITYACFNSTDCDWNALFAEDPDPVFRNQTVNLQVTEYSITGYPTVYCFTSAFLRFPTYSYNPTLGTVVGMDVSQPSNGNPSTDVDPVIINPNYTLFAWAVDPDSTVPSNRTSAITLTSTYKDLIPVGNTSVPNFASLHNLAVAQGLFYVQYYTQDDNPTLNHTTNPLLDSTTSVYVWLYGLESHTSKLAAAVAIFGCVVALIKVTIGSIIRVPHRSFLNMVIGALQQEPPWTALDMSDVTEKDIGKQRVRMEDEKWANFKFGHLD